MASIDEVKESAVKLVVDLKKHFEELRRQTRLVDHWKAAEKAYNNDMDDFYGGVAKVRVPALNQAVEIIVPKMDKSVFPPDGRFFQAVAKDPDDDLSVQDGEAVTALLKEQFKDVDVRSKMIGGYRSLCIYGTLFCSTLWDKKEKKRFKRIDGQRVEQWETVFDNPDFYFPSIWDVYADPKDENLEGFVIERVVKDWHELWEMRKREDEEGVERGIYESSDLQELKDKSVKREDDDPDRQDSERIQGLEGHEYSDHEQKIEVLKCWGPIPKWLITHKEEDRESGEVVEDALVEIAVVGGCQVFLRAIDNPFDHQEKPILRARYIRIDGQLYGHGMMTVNIPLQKELNTLRSHLMDLRSFILKKKWLKDRNANIDETQLKDLHNVVIDTDDVGGLRDIAPQDFGATALPQEGIIKQDIQDGTGASKLLGGTPSGSSLDRTATGLTTVVQGGLERFELVATQFIEDMMKPLVRHFWMLNQQFLPLGRDTALVGKEIVRVIPSEVALEGFDLNFLGVKDIGEKAFKINALNVLIQNIIPFAQFGIDPVPMLMKLVDLLGFGEMRGEIDKRPESQLEETPEGEVQLLRTGRDVRINLNDDHLRYLQAYETMVERPIVSDPEANPQEYTREFLNAISNSQLPDNIRRNLVEAIGQRITALILDRRGVKETLFGGNNEQ